MTRIEWSPRALSDLDAIHSYIALDSIVYADHVVRRLIAAAERLADFPEIGRVVPELGEPHLRERIVRPFRLVYRLRPGLAEIVTVFRSSRLFPADVS